MPNCYNLKNFIINLRSEKKLYFLIYSDELYFLNKIKDIIKIFIKNLNYCTKLIFDDSNFEKNIQNIIWSNIYKQKELIIIEIHNFKYNYFNIIKKIFYYDNIIEKKILIIIYKIKNFIENTSYFKYFLNKLWFLKIYKLSFEKIKNIIKIELNLNDKKKLNCLSNFLIKKFDKNNVLLMQEVFKLKIIFYNKQIYFKNLDKLVFNNYYFFCDNKLLKNLINCNFQKIFKLIQFYQNKIDVLIEIINLFIKFLNNLMVDTNLDFKKNYYYKMNKNEVKKFLYFFINLKFDFKENMGNTYNLDRNWLILINIIVKLMLDFIKLKNS